MGGVAGSSQGPVGVGGNCLESDGGAVEVGIKALRGVGNSNYESDMRWGGDWCQGPEGGRRHQYESDIGGGWR